MNFEHQDFPPELAAIQPEVIPLRRPDRVPRSTISDDYVLFLQEVEPEIFCTHLQEIDLTLAK